MSPLRIATLGTGLLMIVSWWLGRSEPAYYDPVSVADHLAASMNSLVPLAWAVTLLIWGRTAPALRGHWLFFVAAAAFVGMAVFNALEDLGGQEWAEAPWAASTTLGMVATIAAGLVTLTIPTRWRWTGLALLLFLATLGLAPLLSATTWLALAAAIPWLATTSPAPLAASNQP
jgi:hypothetical protein